MSLTISWYWPVMVNAGDWAATVWPTLTLIAEIRMGSSMNTMKPMSITPVSSTPRRFCHSSTTSSVTGVKFSSTVMSPQPGMFMETRASSSCCTSGPSSMSRWKGRYMGRSPRNNTTG